MELSEEQVNELKKKLENMSPEEIEELKKQQEEYMKQQGNECPFCLMAENKISVKKVYEDNEFLAILDINPANKGHVLIFPKEHYTNSLELDREMAMKIYFLANEISKKLVEVVNAEGINLFVANGSVAGQRVEHLILHLIPRFKDDKVSFMWDAKKIDENEFNEIIEGFKDFRPAEEIKEKPEEINYDEYYEEERIP